MPTLGEMFYSAVDATFAVDDRQRIIYWDPGCEELFGRSSQWVLGRPCHSVVCGKDPVTGREFCSDHCSVACLGQGSNGPNNFTIRTRDKNDAELNISVNIALVPASCKQGWISVHLLHKEANVPVLRALDLTNNSQSDRNFSTAASLGVCESAQSRLSNRENEVLQLLAEGLNPRTIAKRLNISCTTTRNHIQHIQGKLGVHSQAEAVSYAYRHNLVG